MSGPESAESERTLPLIWCRTARSFSTSIASEDFHEKATTLPITMPRPTTVLCTAAACDHEEYTHASELSSSTHTHTRAHGGVNYNSCGQLTGSAAYHLKLVVGEGFASICFVNEFARIIRIHVDDDDDIVLESLL